MKIILLFISFIIVNCSHIKKDNPFISKSVVTNNEINRPYSGDKIFGVTIDSIENLPQIISSLKKFKLKPTVRIVFDEKLEPSFYANAISEISKVAFIMGELVDSYYVKNYSIEEYEMHSKRFIEAFSDQISIWEIGNEINGEWLGSTSSVLQKITSSYDEVKKHNGKTALTLYYNEECWEKPENEMFTWVDTNLPDRLKSGLDFVFVSYYEDDCNGLQPNWAEVFKKLMGKFPNSKVGFGEVGSKIQGNKEAYINRYYKMKINNPRFVGGFFWWYFIQDMVPESKPLWKVLELAATSK